MIIINKLLYSYLRTPKQVYIMIANLFVHYNIYPISKYIVLFKKIILHKNLLFGLYLNSNEKHLKVVYFCKMYFEFDTIFNNNNNYYEI